MATRNIVPRSPNEGSLGTQEKPWNNVCANAFNGVNKDLFAKMAAHACIDNQTLRYAKGYLQYRIYNDGHVEMWGEVDNSEQKPTIIIPLPFPIANHSVTTSYTSAAKNFYVSTLLPVSTSKELHISIVFLGGNANKAQLGHLRWHLFGQK